MLQDKEVPKFKSLRLSNLDDVFRRVQRHYGSQEEVNIGGAKRRGALEEASALFRRLSSLRNLTTEALADVYEQALVTKETTELLGTHTTPREVRGHPRDRKPVRWYSATAPLAPLD